MIIATYHPGRVLDVWETLTPQKPVDVGDLPSTRYCYYCMCNLGGVLKPESSSIAINEALRQLQTKSR